MLLLEETKSYSANARKMAKKLTTIYVANLANS